MASSPTVSAEMWTRREAAAAGVDLAELDTCTVCGLVVFLVGVAVHPCCEFARARGEEGCGGCREFKKRVREGKA